MAPTTAFARPWQDSTSGQTGDPAFVGGKRRTARTRGPQDNRLIDVRYPASTQRGPIRVGWRPVKPAASQSPMTLGG